MRLLAAGLNAHGQINDSKQDVYEFEEVMQDVTRIALCTWSTIAWTVGTSLQSKGHRRIGPAPSNAPYYTALGADEGDCIFGDHNGIIGALRRTGVWVPDKSVVRVYKCEHLSGLSQVAVAGNGRCAAVYGAMSGWEPITKVCEYQSFQEMTATWDEHAITPPGGRVFTISGHARQLAAGATSFILLTDTDEVYTWGEARRCSLGRSIVGEEGQSTAHVPGKVYALDGIQIKKVCHGGWMFGAVSNDGAAYLWGLDMPGCAEELDALSDIEGEEDIALLSLTSDIDHEPDVIDMDIGDGHVALVTSSGELLVAGSNLNGQLGLGPDVKSWPAWNVAPRVKGAVQVMCGSKTTAVLVL